MPKGVHLKQLFTGVAMAALVPLSTIAIAGPSESGLRAGGAWAKDFDPGKSFQSATSALGLEDTKTSGELGGEGLQQMLHQLVQGVGQCSEVRQCASAQGEWWCSMSALHAYMYCLLFFR